MTLYIKKIDYLGVINSFFTLLKKLKIKSKKLIFQFIEYFCTKINLLLVLNIIVNQNVETKKEYHKLCFLEKLKDQAICPACNKNLNSIIALKHHYKHNTKCQLIQYIQDVKTLLAIMPNVLEHL